MNALLFKLLICLIAGCGAGLSTGFAGLSAAVYISPMLVAFLDVPVFQAVAISLASDVLASAVSAITYAKNGNIDLKRGKYLMIPVLIMTVLGSGLAFLITNNSGGDAVLGFWSIASSFALGISFLFPKKERKPRSVGKRRILSTVLIGIYIGFVCGFQGAGGGLMMLFALTIIMQMAFQTAVGTSVFIMTFTALIGAVSHFIMKGMPEWDMLIICILSTCLFARIGAGIANRVDEKKLRFIIGILLTVSGIAMLMAKFL